MRPRPTLVFVAPKLPYPLTDGLSIRHFHLLRAYSRIAQVRLVFFHEDPTRLTDAVPLEPYCADFHPVRADSVLHRRVRLLSLSHRRWHETATLTPTLARMFTSPDMQGLVRTLSETADIVHVSRLFMVPNVEPAMRSGSTTRFVLDLDDVETVVARRARRLTPAPTWRRRVFDSLDALRLASFQARALRRFDRVFVCSTHDQSRLRRARPLVVPNGATIPAQLLPDPFDGHTILFLGLLSYEPNVDGLLFFVKDVLPLIRTAVPTVRLLVVGRHPGPEVLALHDGQSIRVAADVAAVEPYYQQATLSTVVLRMGGGTRVRILEAFALGRPVVSTTIGCEGLEVKDGEHLLIADDPRRIAQRCVDLLTKPELARRLVAAGRKLAETVYDWKLIEQDVERIATGLLTSPGKESANVSPAQR